MMKKVMLAVALCGATGIAGATALSATGAALCAGTGGTATVDPTAGKFIKNQFTITCSNNVYLSGAEDTLKAGVAAGSAKGKNIFGGYTEGGGVKAMGTDCGSDGCTASEVTGMADNALAGST